MRTAPDRWHLPGLRGGSVRPRANPSLTPTVTVDAGEVVTDAIGNRYRAVLVDGKPLVRAVRPGDLFLARSTRVRVVACHGAHFRGLLRQIVEAVQ
jgi:hypothetical protein